MNYPKRSVKSVILLVALRNLIIHLRRTLLTVGAIAVGLASLIFLWGFNHGLHRNMLSNFQDAIIGSIQIHQQGFFEQPKLANHLTHPKKIIHELEQANISHWSQRLESFALATSETATEGVMMIGMDPVRELQVTGLTQRIGEGRFLQPGDDYVLILGATTANNLKVSLGDALVMVGYDRYGVLVAEEFTLIGIITSGEMGLDRGMALTTLDALQEMLDMSGRFTTLVMRAPEKETKPIAEQLRTALSKENLEVMAWSDMFPIMQEWVNLHNGFLYLFIVIVLFIVLAGQLNTMLLAMLERTREFGIFMAIGTRRIDIAIMLVFEALMIGVIGTLLGIALGLLVISITANTGIDLSILLGETSRFYVDPVVYPQLNLDHLITTVVSILLASLLAGLYPAWRATQLQPVEAIRHG